MPDDGPVCLVPRNDMPPNILRKSNIVVVLHKVRLQAHAVSFDQEWCILNLAGLCIQVETIGLFG